jgi:hypothetical protein
MGGCIWHAGLKDVGLGAVAAKASAALINAALGPKTRPVTAASISSLNVSSTLDANAVTFSHSVRMDAGQCKLLVLEDGHLHPEHPEREARERHGRL